MEIANTYVLLDLAQFGLLGLVRFQVDYALLINLPSVFGGQLDRLTRKVVDVDSTMDLNVIFSVYFAIIFLAVSI
jgi:hypothetical protein